MRIGVPRETFPTENRVALIPAEVARLCKHNLEVTIESGAGESAGFSDDDYTAKGATIAPARDGLFRTSDIVLQVRCYPANEQAGKEDFAHLRAGQILIGMMNPLGAPIRVKELADTGVTALAMELIPRITRAQSMDALSSMATLAGYKAVLMAAERLPKMFPMMMTAAGSLTPARVFVLGAGVAGLQAIATAKRLGAVVEGYDIRPEVKEQVQSVGGKFVELDIKTDEAGDAGGYAKAQTDDFYTQQQALLHKHVAASDVVITTAAIPGRKAPILVTETMARSMKRGSVIVDLAAETGGNCELTVAGQDTLVDGVTICGPTNLPAQVPNHASQMYARNVTNLVELLLDDASAVNLNLEDEIIAGTLITQNNQVVHARIQSLLEAAS